MKNSSPKELKKKVVSQAPSPQPKKQRELTPEQRSERQAQVNFLLQVSREELEQAQQREERKRAEVIELLGGVKTSLREIDALITAKRRPYAPLFPNTISFWSEIFRLNMWDHRDPAAYEKPAIVGIWVCELIYDRFVKEVLPALRQLNPSVYNGFRNYKHFQFLTEEGQSSLIRFRDEAIELMKNCVNWYEFRKRMLSQYGVSFQGELFE